MPLHFHDAHARENVLFCINKIRSFTTLMCSLFLSTNDSIFVQLVKFPRSGLWLALYPSDLPSAVAFALLASCLTQHWERCFQSLKSVFINRLSVAASGKWRHGLQNTTSLEVLFSSHGNFLYHRALKLLYFPARVVTGNELTLGLGSRVINSGQVGWGC